MAKRSTVNVSYVRDRANSFFRNSDDSTPEMRLGMAALLESVLFETDNYKGYVFLDSEWDLSNPDRPQLRDGYDQTRRLYR